MDSTIWTNLLSATGGKLELAKCFYYILSWKFSAQGDAIPETIEDQETMTNLITVTDKINKESGIIAKKETSTSP